MTLEDLSWPTFFEMLAFAGVILALAIGTLYGVYSIRRHIFLSAYERSQQDFWGNELEMSEHESRFSRFWYGLFVELRQVIVLLLSVVIWGGVLFGLLYHRHWVPDEVQKYIANKLH